MLGVLGGLGPLATNLFLKKLYSYVKAERDQDYPEVIVYYATKTPDRTAYILGKGENPLNYLIRGAKLLEKAGADRIAMPCNTAHYFIDKIRKAVSVPVVDMPRVALLEAKERGFNKLLLLSTEGTKKAKIYEKRAEELSIEITYPEEMSRVMEAIYLIKANRLKDAETLLKPVVEKAELPVVLGCTELPIIIEERKDIIDPMGSVIRYLFKNE